MHAHEMSMRNQFRGEVSVADASAGVAYTIYRNGSVAAQPITAEEFVLVTHRDIVTTAAGNVAIGMDTDTVGKRIAKGNMQANGGFAGPIEPQLCPKGVVPKAFAPAGQCDSTIYGYILKSGRGLT